MYLYPAEIIKYDSISAENRANFVLLVISQTSNQPIKPRHRTRLDGIHDVDIRLHSLVVGVTGPFHDDIGRDAHGEGIDDKGAATGVGADQFPLGLDLVSVDVALVGGTLLQKRSHYEKTLLEKCLLFIKISVRLRIQHVFPVVVVRQVRIGVGPVELLDVLRNPAGLVVAVELPMPAVVIIADPPALPHIVQPGMLSPGSGSALGPTGIRLPGTIVRRNVRRIAAGKDKRYGYRYDMEQERRQQALTIMPERIWAELRIGTAEIPADKAKRQQEERQHGEDAQYYDPFSDSLGG